MTMLQAKLQALKFLHDNGPDTIKEITNEGELCATMVFISLLDDGLVDKVKNGDGLTWAINRQGIKVLQKGNKS